MLTERSYCYQPHEIAECSVSGKREAIYSSRARTPRQLNATNTCTQQCAKRPRYFEISHVRLRVRRYVMCTVDR